MLRAAGARPPTAAELAAHEARNTYRHRDARPAEYNARPFEAVPEPDHDASEMLAADV